MRRLAISPFLKITGDAGATSAVGSKSIYLPSVDNSSDITATITASGTWGGATLAAKFQDSADDSTYADVANGGFTSLTADGNETITFKLGTNLALNTGTPNYGKFLRILWSTTGGGAGDIDFTITLSGVGLPDDSITLKLYN